MKKLVLLFFAVLISALSYAQSNTKIQGHVGGFDCLDLPGAMVVVCVDATQQLLGSTLVNAFGDFEMTVRAPVGTRIRVIFYMMGYEVTTKYSLIINGTLTFNIVLEEENIVDE